MVDDGVGVAGPGRVLVEQIDLDFLEIEQQLAAQYFDLMQFDDVIQFLDNPGDRLIDIQAAGKENQKQHEQI